LRLSANLHSLAARFPSQILELRQLGLAAGLKFADPLGGALMRSAIIEREPLDALIEALNQAVVDCWGSRTVRA
jgi:hypothetical protein